jgi:hypothetical protein
MIGSWNTRARPSLPRHQRGNAESVAQGPNLSRRAFVEIAVASAAGATLVGFTPNQAAASEIVRQDGNVPPCSGRGLGGWASEVIEYEDLVRVHRSHR